MTHTPGPWQWSYRNWKNQPTIVPHITGEHGEEIDDDGTVHTLCTAVATVVANATSKDVSRLNAQLIAAAPELLAALKALVAKHDFATCDHPWGNCQDTGCIGYELDQAKAVIARAERESTQ